MYVQDAEAKKKAMATSARKKAQRESTKAAASNSDYVMDQVESTGDECFEDDETESSEDLSSHQAQILRPRAERKRYAELGGDEDDSDSDIFDVRVRRAWPFSS